MADLLVYYAHPGQRHSHANKAMLAEANGIDDIRVVDLYAEYPRFEIDVEREQRRLLDHSVILFQFPMFWYSTPSIIKEWQDLVLEYGFAYGSDGDNLKGKRMMLAITAAGPDDAYAPQGYQHYPIRTFLTPLEQTARLCNMASRRPTFCSRRCTHQTDGRLEQHLVGYRNLLEAIRDDRYDFAAVADRDVVCANNLPITGTP